MASYMRDPELNKFIPREEWVEKYGPVPKMKSKSGQAQILEEFQSPIDGSRIGDHKQLAEHNKKHGVTNIADYEKSHFEKRGKEMAAEASGQTPEAKQERKELIDNTMKAYGV